jgi:hypothetical protein
MSALFSTLFAMIFIILGVGPDRAVVGKDLFLMMFFAFVGASIGAIIAGHLR